LNHEDTKSTKRGEEFCHRDTEDTEKRRELNQSLFFALFALFAPLRFSLVCHLRALPGALWAAFVVRTLWVSVVQ
jgi:hypothetical protein